MRKLVWGLVGSTALAVATALYYYYNLEFDAPECFDEDWWGDC